VTGALLERRGPLFADDTARVGSERPGGGAHRAAGGGITLEDLLNATLRQARTNGSIECPLCHARMSSTRTGAECEGCRSRIG
jgi:hypothetical protein